MRLYFILHNKLLFAEKVLHQEVLSTVINGD